MFPQHRKGLIDIGWKMYFFSIIAEHEAISPASHVAEPLNKQQATHLNTMQATSLTSVNSKEVTGRKRKGITESGIPSRKVKFNEGNNKTGSSHF